MRGHIAKKGSHYYPVIDLGHEPAQRCADCRKRTWLADGRLSRCAKCGGTLTEGPERRQKWHPGQRRKKDAEAALTAILNQKATQTYVEPSRVELANFFDGWILTVANELKPSTVDGYRRIFDRYLRYRIGGLRLQQLSTAALSRLYTDLEREGGKDGRPLSRTTVVHVHALISKLLADAVALDLVVRNVAERDFPGKPKALRPRERTHKVWGVTELTKFLAFVEGDRLAALWRVLIATGCRRGEALGMKWTDVDLDGGRWTITRAIGVVNGSPLVGTPKTTKGHRVVTLDPATAAILKAHRRRQLEERMAWGPAYQDDGWVFAHEDGRHLHPNVITRLFGRLVARAGLPPLTVHGLRHSVITSMINAKTPVPIVAERVGHSTTAFTMDAYWSAIESAQREAGDAFAAAIDGPALDAGTSG
jgi:integrase